MGRRRNLRAMQRVALAWVLAALASADAWAAAPPGYTPEDLRRLSGAIDLHAHMGPDTPSAAGNPRGMDVLDLSKLAAAVGMRGFAAKLHGAETAEMAYLARKATPGVEVFGVLVSNLAIGGLNPAAVQRFAQVDGGWGRIVMMPTVDAEEEIRLRGPAPRPFVRVSDGGELTGEAKAVIALVAGLRTRGSNGELVLATGHVSAREALMVIREGRRAGVRHMVVTHARHAPPDMSLAQMQEAVAMGAFIEFVVPDVLSPDERSPTWGVARVGGETPVGAETLKDFVTAFRTLGADHVVIGSDCNGKPDVPRCLADAAKHFRSAGVSERDLDLMMKENPARLLGLPRTVDGGAATERGTSQGLD